MDDILLRDDQSIELAARNATPTRSDLPSELRCAFVPPGAGPRVIYGENDAGDLVHILDATRGRACGLICPDCRGELIANKGEIKAPYFSHASRIECDQAGETALHLIAKEIIEQSGKLRLPVAKVYGLDGYEIVRKAEEVNFTRVEVEPFYPGFRPDVVGIKEVTRDGKATAHRLLIEIFVTHKVDEEKLARLERNGETALEIDLSKVDRAISREELADLLLTDADRTWLHHKVVARRKAEIEDERARRRKIEEENLARKKARTASILQEQEDARAAAPRGATQDFVDFAEHEHRRWQMIGLEKLLFAGGDDSYFDVQPIVWRTMVFCNLAPWGGAADRWAKQNDPTRLAQAVSLKMRELGWAKPPFARDNLKRYNKRRFRLEPWDPLGEEVRTLLRKAHSLIRPVMNALETPGLAPICSAAAISHDRYKGFLGDVDALSSALAGYGAELRLNGRLINGPSDVDEILLGLPERDRLLARREQIVTMTKVVELDEPGVTLNGMALERLGFDVRFPSDTSEDAADHVWQAIEKRHQEAWDARLEDWQHEAEATALQSAQTVASYYVDLCERLPSLKDAFAFVGAGFLLDTQELLENLRRDRAPNSASDLKALKVEITTEAQRYGALKFDLERLMEFCDGIKDTHLSLRVLEYGCEVAIRNFREQRNSTLPGISSRHDASTILDEIGQVMQKAEKSGYGEDFTARALYSTHPESSTSVIEAVFAGRVPVYRKAFRDIIWTNRPPPWVYRR